MKTRMIKSTFRSDNYIESLTPPVKLVYLYLFTNEYVDMCGVYEVSIKRICTDTGYPIDTVSKAMDTLSQGGRIVYYNGWVYLRKFTKHQNINSPKIKLAINRSIELVPKDIVDFFKKEDERLDTVSIPYTGGIATYTYRDNLDLDFNPDDTVSKNLVEDFINKRNAVEVIGDKKGLPKTVKKNYEIEKIRDKRIEEYTVDEIDIALNNYCNDILKRKLKNADDTYYDHRFTLLEFLTQKNGLPKYINL